jgi:hypothetical protein
MRPSVRIGRNLQAKLDTIPPGAPATARGWGDPLPLATLFAPRVAVTTSMFNN